MTKIDQISSRLAGYVFAAVFVALSAMGIAHAQTSGEPIKIGAVLSVTGAGAGLGIPERNGILLAVKTINAKGGIGGRPLEIIIEDDGSNPDTALVKVNELIHGKKVIAILGGTILASTVAIGGVTHALGMPHLAFTGLGPAVERERKCLFHLPPSQLLNARAMLEYARSINAKNIGVLHDAGYGNVVMTVLNQIHGEYGIRFSVVEKFEIGATDTTALAAKVKAANPDAVMIITSNAIPFRNAKQIQLNKPIIAGLGTASYEYAKAMGIGADDVVHPEFVIAEDPLPKQKPFIDAYLAEHKVLPKNFEALGWDGVHLLAAAITKAGPNAASSALCDALRGPASGVFADYNFSADDLNGITLSSYVYSKLVKGTFTRLPFRNK